MRLMTYFILAGDALTGIFGIEACLRDTHGRKLTEPHPASLEAADSKIVEMADWIAREILPRASESSSADQRPVPKYGSLIGQCKGLPMVPV